ncbi:MAG TPA: hypothetical protein VFD58_31360 [Blastocatellia bacterium]|nr:hypothetical protein [Blastocatellia bacterium]
MTRTLFSTVAALILLSLTITAQTPGAPDSGTSQEKQKARKELEQKAAALLDEVLTDAQALRLPENRLRVQAIAASLLWKRDEQRARALFGEVKQTLITLLNAPDDEQTLRPDSLWLIIQKRQEMLHLIAQLDAPLALEFLRATRPPIGFNGYQPEHDAQLELMVAANAAARDPQQALLLAEENLAKGKLPDGVMNVLYQLQASDRAAAAKLASDIVSRLRSTSLVSGYEYYNAARSLIQLAAPNGGNEEQQAQPDSRKQSPLIAESVVRELIEQMINNASEALANPRDPGRLEIARSMLNELTSSLAPLVEKYAPTRVPALRRNTTESEQTLNPADKAWRDFNKFAEKASIEALLEGAPNAAPEMRNAWYQGAANKAIEQGQAERARQIITEHITDPGQRRQMLTQLDHQMLWRLQSEGKLDEARQALLRLRTAEERASILTTLALRVGGGNRKLALQYLDEAWEMIGGQAENNRQLDAQLRVVGAYQQLSSARGFEILDPMVDQFNELYAAAAVLSAFENHGTFRDREWVMASGSVTSNMLQNFTQTLAGLARADFDRAKAITGRFSRPDVRTHVRLSLIQTILTSRPEDGSYPRSGPRSAW